MNHPTFQPPSAGTPAARANPYVPIHGALRRCMADTLARMGTLRVDDVRELTAVTAQVQELLLLLRRHALIESLVVHPAIEAVSPGATRSTQEEHELHLAAMVELQAETETLAARPTVAAAERLHRHLARLVAENLTHMQDEETRLAPLLLDGYDESEMAAIDVRALACVTPVERAALMRWFGEDAVVARHPG